MNDLARPIPDVLLAGARTSSARLRSARDWRGYGWALAVVALTTAVGWPMYHIYRIENENVLMLYLLGVLWIATRFSRGAAILASVLGVAMFDWFFVPPYNTLAVSESSNVVTFAVMLLTALVISALTHRVRMQAEVARAREHRTAALLDLSRDLSSLRTTDDILSATGRYISNVLRERAVLLLPNISDQRLTVKGDSAETMTLDEKEMSVAQWAFQHNQPAGRGTDTLPSASGTFIPLRAPRGVVGVIGVIAPADDGHWSGDRRQLVEGMASQAAVAIERANLAEETRVAWERVEAEFLRNTLLSGVSHELRTPLAGITGAASTLAEAGAGLSSDARAEMLETIQTEAERMERLISNLLDMTRMEAGGLAMKKEWLPLEEVVGSALSQLERRLHGRKVLTHIPSDLPLVCIDAAGIEQVLANLLDNAVEYTPADTPIEITAEASATGDVSVWVSDHGPGIPSGTEKRVFEKFFRARPTETRRGIGLGLAISRGIVEAHGGTISAQNRTDGTTGALFRFSLPSCGAPPVMDTSA